MEIQNLLFTPIMQSQSKTKEGRIFSPPLSNNFRFQFEQSSPFMAKRKSFLDKPSMMVDSSRYRNTSDDLSHNISINQSYDQSQFTIRKFNDLNFKVIKESNEDFKQISLPVMQSQNFSMGGQASGLPVPRIPRDPRDRNPNNYDYMKLIRTRRAAIMQKYSLYCQQNLPTNFKKSLGIKNLPPGKKDMPEQQLRKQESTIMRNSRCKYLRGNSTSQTV